MKLFGLLLIFTSALCVTSWSQTILFRGPYLQKATQETIVVRWMTNQPVGSKVSFGFEPGNYFSVRFDTTSTYDHTLELTGLLPNTRYYYAIHTMDSLLSDNPNQFFETLPPSGTPGDYTFLVLGDAGQGNQGQLEVSEALQNKYGNHHDGLILLGDNAYWNGTQEEYQYKFFDGFYNDIIENTVIWPAPGNHDYYGGSVPMSTNAPYFDIFDLPSQGECGGVPSLTEQFYSFDYGDIHFLSLDSYAVDRTDTSYMAEWLENDLQQNQLPWIVAYWHHPPYSKGSHDSDNFGGNDVELVEMRENIVPILEKYNVDLVLCGHSHSYERSLLISKHYGLSQTFYEGHIRSRSSGDYPDDCPYLKFSDSTANDYQGTVYSVVGVSGWLSGTKPDWPHPAMYSYSVDHLGGLFLRISGNVLTAEFLTKDEVVFDRYVIFKDIAFNEDDYCGDLVAGDWMVYPNPGTDNVTLFKSNHISEPGEEFLVYDVNGKLIHRRILNYENILNFSNDPEGIYLIEVREKERTTYLKFIKV